MLQSFPFLGGGVDDSVLGLSFAQQKWRKKSVRPLLNMIDRWLKHQKKGLFLKILKAHYVENVKFVQEIYEKSKAM
jgi:hypothetical protein